MALGLPGLKIRFGGDGDEPKSRADLEKGGAAPSFVEHHVARTRRFVSQNLAYIIIVSAVVVFVRIYSTRTLITLSNVPEAAIVEVDPHPIPRLIAEAEERFTKKVARQSRTLPEAAAEYRRRYGRNPPKGFDKWWAFAQENEFVMVDEFDGLIDDLAPFWEISGEELSRRALQVRAWRKTRGFN